MSYPKGMSGTSYKTRRHTTIWERLEDSYPYKNRAEIILTWVLDNLLGPILVILFAIVLWVVLANLGLESGGNTGGDFMGGGDDFGVPSN